MELAPLRWKTAARDSEDRKHEKRFEGNGQNRSNVKKGCNIWEDGLAM